MISTLQISRIKVVTDQIRIPNCRCNVPIVDLVCFFNNMAKIVLEKVEKELKLVKVVVTSRYWRSCGPFNKALWQ